MATTSTTTTEQPQHWYAITNLRLQLLNISTTNLTSSQLVGLTQNIRLLETATATIKIRIAQRADKLTQDGQSPDPTQTSLGNGRVSAKTARQEAARAKTADELPGLGDALEDGDISTDHLDTVTRQTKNLNDEEKAALKKDEEDLVNKAKNLPVDTFNRHLARRIDDIRQDHGRTTERKQRAESYFRHWVDKTTGMGRFTGALDPERFESIVNAIETEMRSMAQTAKRDGSTQTLHLNDHLAASALVELISHGNGKQGRPNIVVITDHETLSSGPHDNTVRETRNGQDLSTEAIARLCCDAVMQRVVVDADAVAINVGRAQRTATTAQWTALNAMHSTCAWAGCDRPISWCQAHHIQEWDPDGLTDLDNLVPLCSTHHHRVHEGRWSIKLLPDRTLKIYQPDGTHYTNTAPDRLQNWLKGNKPGNNSAGPKDRSAPAGTDTTTAPPSPKASRHRGPRPKTVSAKAKSRTRRASDRQPSRQ